MKLFYTPGTWSTVPRILLAEGGIASEQESVSFKTRQTSSGADYLQINPNGYVPALQLDDGSVLTEVAAVAQYIADLVPAKKLVPANGTVERYQQQSWLHYIATELHKNYSILFNRTAAEEWKTAAREKIAQRLPHAEKALANQPFLQGQDFTAADAYLFVVLNWSALVNVDLTSFPKLQDFLARVSERESVKSIKAADTKK